MSLQRGRARDQSAADRLVDALGERIRSGEFAVGSRLPSERALSLRFGASRTTVRQAVRLLESRGILEVRDRSGIYVQAPSSDRVSEALMRLIAWRPRAITIRDLLEIRMLFEIEIAGLAAERWQEDDLRQMARMLADTVSKAAVAHADPSEDALAAWAAADVDFHGSIARATANPLFTIIYDSLRPALVEQRRRTGTALPQTRAKSFQYHQRIFDRVCARDSVAAREAMREHLHEARQAMLEYAAGAEKPLSLETDGIGERLAAAKLSSDGPDV